MIYNNVNIINLDLGAAYLKRLKDDNYEFSLMEIDRLSSTRLQNVTLPPVMKKVKCLIDGLGEYLDIREDDVVRLDINMKDCVEIRFASRRDVKVNLYIEDRTLPFEDLQEPDYDEDEMYFSYKQNNRRCIMHGTMERMIEALKQVLHET